MRMNQWLLGLPRRLPMISLALAVLLSSGVVTTTLASDDDNPEFSVQDTTETAREGVEIPDDEDESDMIEDAVA